MTSPDVSSGSFVTLLTKCCGLGSFTRCSNSGGARDVPDGGNARIGLNAPVPPLLTERPGDIAPTAAIVVVSVTPSDCANVVPAVSLSPNRSCVGAPVCTGVHNDETSSLRSIEMLLKALVLLGRKTSMLWLLCANASTIAGVPVGAAFSVGLLLTFVATPGAPVGAIACISWDMLLPLTLSKERFGIGLCDGNAKDDAPPPVLFALLGLTTGALLVLLVFPSVSRGFPSSLLLLPA
mmetsp:Transcript_44486/g.123093  ORF Transcript_44486/g.123093 Transcript_44486/m.123093 type:complete len:237 (-) Transcript_44486:2976-3686(-)